MAEPELVTTEAIGVPTGVASADVSTITTQEEAGLANSTNLGVLSSGILKISVALGVASILSCNLADTTHACTLTTTGATSVTLPTSGTLISDAPSDGKTYGRKDGAWAEAAGAYSLPIASASVLGGIKIGSGFAIDGDGIVSVTAGGVGTVTSVGLSLPAELSVSGSPVTAAGTLSATWTNQTANYGLMGPASGAAGTPAFRALVAADIPGSVVGKAMLALADPGAITFPRFNADNSVTALSAANFRTAIGAGTGNGTVTSVSGTAPIVSSGGATPAISITSVDATHAGSVPLSGTPAARNFLIAAATTGTVSWGTLTKPDVGLGSVENTALSTWAGTSNITTIGTIATGVWHGSAIADSYISSAATWNALVSFPGFGTSHATAAYGDHTHSGVYAPVAQTMYIGTTGVAINRASATLAITGVTFSGTLRDDQTSDGGHVASVVLNNEGAAEGSGTAIYMGYQAAGVGFYGARILQIGYPNSSRLSDLSLQVHKSSPGDNADTSWLTGLKINRTTGLAETPQGLLSGADITLNYAAAVAVRANVSGTVVGALRWTTGALVLSSESTTMYFRPNGDTSVTAQMTYTPAGLLTIPSVNIAELTASRVVFTDASKNLVSVATTGTGSVVLADSPTITGTLTVSDLELSGLISTDPGAGVITFAGGSAKTVVLAASTGYVGFYGSSGASRASAPTAVAASAPAGGTGAAAGGWDTAAHRDTAITLLNNLRTVVGELVAIVKGVNLCAT